MAIWCKGNEHCAADILSRLPILQPCDDDDQIADDVASPAVLQLLSTQLNPKQPNLRLEKVCQATDADPELQNPIVFIQNGFPDAKGELPVHLCQFWLSHD